MADVTVDAPRMRIVQPDEVRTGSEVRSGLPATSAVDVPSDEEIIDTLVAHNGIPVRAAAMLGVTEELILKVAARNVRLLSSRTRARVMLSSFTTVLKLDATLQANIEDMGLDSLGRTYSASLQAFTNLAGQFEEQQTSDDTDDATAAKDSILERLGNMGKREAAARAMQDVEDSVFSEGAG